MGQTFGVLLGLEIREARESRGWTQLARAETAFADPHAERRIRSYETGEVGRPQAKVYMPICDALGISRQRIGELKAMAADAKAVNDSDVADIIREKGNLEQALTDLRHLTRLQLEALATRFEVAQPHDLADGALFEVLTNKAQDYRLVRAEIEAIPETMLRLSNIKAEAKAAFATGDMDAVESLLSMVQAVEVEETARTAESRANVA
jgi:transcriptional regulator with XRE-family HTH domain